MWVWSLSRKDPLEEGMTTYSRILVWRIPWTEESGRLQSMVSQSQTRLKRLSTHTCTMSLSFGFQLENNLGALKKKCAYPWTFSGLSCFFNILNMILRCKKCWKMLKVWREKELRKIINREMIEKKAFRMLMKGQIQG